ncbi:hypothetical protein M569_02300, partial [Genlisea aurea]
AMPSEPEHLPCPRCDSTNTKFCYYNNYNFSQPRHFCKSCRRYWTHGGTLRDIPIGGGSRKGAKRPRPAAAVDVGASFPCHDSRRGDLSAPSQGLIPMNGSFTSLLNNHHHHHHHQNVGGILGFGFEEVGFGRSGWPFYGPVSDPIAAAQPWHRLQNGDGGGGGGGFMGGGDCIATFPDLAI